MMPTDKIKVKIKDNKVIRSLIEAEKVMDNPSSHPQTIEHYMKKLFREDNINQEVIDMYNRLERRWKMLVNYKTNENHVI